LIQIKTNKLKISMEIVLKEIKRHLNCTNKEYEEDFYLYEIVCCHLFGVKIWSLLEGAEKRGFLHDIGIDGWNEETKTALQVKYHRSSNITHRELSTFYSLASRFSAEEILLVCCDESKITKQVRNVYFSEPRLMNYDVVPKELYLKEIEKIQVSEIEDTEEIFCYGADSEEDPDCVYPKKDESQMKLRDYQKKVVDTYLESSSNPFRARMATGLGKSLVIKSITQTAKKVAIIVPLISILNELSTYFDEDEICRVGTGHNNDIDYDKKIFICVDDSWEHICDLDFEMIIFDEAHHTYKQIRDDLDENVRVLEFSATLKGKDLDIDYNLGWGIENGWLNNYNLELIFCSGYDYLVQSICEHPEWLRILGFCNSLENIDRVGEILEKYGIEYGVITSRVGLGERDALIRKFKNFEIKVLLSIGCLTEGVDIPEACTCLFFDGITDSDRSIQRMGRVLRKSDKKDKSFVVAPINGEADDFAILDFLKILCRNEGCESIQEFIKKGKVGFSSNFEKEVEIEEEIENYTSRLYECVSDGWMLTYNMVVKFVEEEGRLPSSMSKNKYERKLGYWCSDRRKNYKNKLSDERIEKLNMVRGWYWDFDEIRDEQWNFKLELVIEYKDLHNGNKKNWLPQSRTVYRNERIGSWLHTQKTALKNGTLSAERIQKLDEKLLGWRETKKEIIWNLSLGLNIEYKELLNGDKKNGLAQQRTVYKNEPIGQWLYTQKKALNSDTLSLERIQKLDEKLPGWRNTKDEEDEARWNLMFKLNIEYKDLLNGDKKNGLAQQKTVYKYEQIGYWLDRQKVCLNSETLSLKKIQKLDEKLPGWRNTKDEEDEVKWNLKLELNIEYKNLLNGDKKNGLAKARTVYGDELIGSWLFNQKTYFKNGKLSVERIQELDQKLPGWKPLIKEIEIKDFYTLEELKKLTVPNLMNILRDKNIAFIKKGKKEYYIDLILANS